MDGLPPRREALESNGLYDLRAAGHAPRIADEVIGARAASSTEARLLSETRNAPLLTMTRTAWDASGRGIEYGFHPWSPMPLGAAGSVVLETTGRVSRVGGAPAGRDAGTHAHEETASAAFRIDRRVDCVG